MRAPRCLLGYEPDLVVRAVRGDLPEADAASVREHLARCASCAANQRAHALACELAVASMEETTVEREEAVERIVGDFARRAHVRRTRTALVATLAAAAAVLFATTVNDRWQARRSASVVSQAAPRRTSDPAELQATKGSRAQEAAREPEPFVRGRRSMIVMPGSSVGRIGTHALAAGASVVEAETLDIRAGERLVLSFSVEQAVVSPRAGVLLEGPAAAFVESEGVRVTQGRVHVVAAEASLEVSSAYARTRGVRAAWTMDVDAERTRVVVLSGVVEIVGDGEAERLSAGASVVCDARGVHRVPASPARRSLLHEDGPPARTAPPETPADDVDGRLSDALRALRAGDRAHAEEALTAFLAVAALGDARRAYATFRLAELELARRDVADARPRLLALVNGADSALAEDAATLLASSYPAPSRAEAWASYAGVAPSGSRRARARLEEARARAAAGDAPGARRAAHAACAEDAVDVCREAERLGLVH